MAISTGFGDLLDVRFKKIFWENYDALPDMLPELFAFEETYPRNEQKYSAVGTFDDFGEFTGTLTYDDVFQGYDSTATHVEFAKGFQVERKLFKDEQFNIMDQRPKGLSAAAQRTRQKHGARQLNNAFSVDTYFGVNTEGVALCSNSHTTTSGASTAAGFDNLVTAALSAVSVAAGRIQAVGFRGDRAERISVMPNEIWIPPDLYENAYEIVSSMGKVDVATNNANVHYGQYNIYEWNYLTSARNWFLFDSSLRKQFLLWLDREPLEFGWVEDFDTFVAKYRGYMRYANLWTNWRFALGANVS